MWVHRSLNGLKSFSSLSESTFLCTKDLEPSLITSSRRAEGWNCASRASAGHDPHGARMSVYHVQRFLGRPPFLFAVRGQPEPVDLEVVLLQPLVVGEVVVPSYLGAADALRQLLEGEDFQADLVHLHQPLREDPCTYWTAGVAQGKAGGRFDQVARYYGLQFPQCCGSSFVRPSGLGSACS